MSKNDPHYDYFAITSAKNWFEMRCQSLSNIKKAIIELLQKNEISEGSKIEVKRFSTDKVKHQYIVWNKAKTSVNFVNDDPTVAYKTLTGDDILVELKKLYERFDNPVSKLANNKYQICIEDKNAKQFKKDFIENHKVKAKQVIIDKTCYDQWFEQKADGTYIVGYYNFIIIDNLNELKVKIS